MKSRIFKVGCGPVYFGSSIQISASGGICELSISFDNRSPSRHGPERCFTSSTLLICALKHSFGFRNWTASPALTFKSGFANSAGITAQPRVGTVNTAAILARSTITVSSLPDVASCSNLRESQASLQRVSKTSFVTRARLQSGRRRPEKRRVLTPEGFEPNPLGPFLKQAVERIHFKTTVDP